MKQKNFNFADIKSSATAFLTFIELFDEGCFAFGKASQYFTSFVMSFQMVNKPSAAGTSSTQLKKTHSKVSTTNIKKVTSYDLLTDIFYRCMFWSFSCCMFQNMSNVCKIIANCLKQVNNVYKMACSCSIYICSQPPHIYRIVKLDPT